MLTELPGTARVVSDLPELQRALRERAETLDISREALDEIAGLAKGYAAKLLSEPPVKFLGVHSMFPMLGALGYEIALIEGDQRFQKRAAKRKPGGPRGTKWRNARALAVARAWGLQGAKSALANMTQTEISTQRSRAAKARWRKHRLEMRAKAELMRAVQLPPLARKKRAKSCQDKSAPRRAPQPIAVKRKSVRKPNGALSAPRNTRSHHTAQPRRSAPASTAKGAQARPRQARD